MNLKTVRGHYALLSLGERLTLFHAAFCRCDEAEARAIQAASPKVDYRMSDFSLLMQRISLFHHFVLLERIGFANTVCFSVIGNDKSRPAEEFMQFFEGGRLAAYLYVIETDGWQQACQKFGISSKEFERWQAKYFFAAEMLADFDDLLRDFAFSEEEVKERFPNARTVESVSKNYLAYLRQIEAE